MSALIPDWEVRVGHCLDLLSDVPDCSVDCVVTSPPYWALRDYGDACRDWPAMSYAPAPGLPAVEVPASHCALGLEGEVAHYVGHLVLVFCGVHDTQSQARGALAPA